MTLTPETHVADIAAALPSSVRVFQKYGIDFCCGGKKPIGEVCTEHQVGYSELAQAITEAAAVPASEDRDWAHEPLHALAEHIVVTYHDPLREELPRLQYMAAKVRAVHESRAGQPLGRIDALVKELSADMHEHMIKEEHMLFPAIRALEANGTAFPISMPVAVMEQEHDRAGELLAELRTITDGYVTPEWACQTYRSLFHGLEELERGMHVHVHLENNVLFPRALQLAEGVTTGAD